jgi:hypothetical protein
MRYCQIHLEECGEKRPAVEKIKASWMDKKTWVCEECLKDICETAAAERKYQSGYDYACGYRD